MYCRKKADSYTVCVGSGCTVDHELWNQWLWNRGLAYWHYCPGLCVILTNPFCFGWKLQGDIKPINVSDPEHGTPFSMGRSCQANQQICWNL